MNPNPQPETELEKWRLEKIHELETDLATLRRKLEQTEQLLLESAARIDRDADKISKLDEVAKRLALRSETALRVAGELAAALDFYADPDSYFAIFIMPDRPAGGFADDFSEDHGGDYDRPMPGKLARETLAAYHALTAGAAGLEGEG